MRTVRCSSRLLGGGLHRGGVCLGKVYARGGVCQRPPTWTEWQTPVKTLPCRNYVTESNEWFKPRFCDFKSFHICEGQGAVTNIYFLTYFHMLGPSFLVPTMDPQRCVLITFPYPDMKYLQKGRWICRQRPSCGTPVLSWRCPTRCRVDARPRRAGPAPGRAPASRPPARPPPRTPHPHPLPQTETCSPAIIHTHPLFKLSHKSTYSRSFSHSNSLDIFKPWPSYFGMTRIAKGQKIVVIHRHSYHVCFADLFKPVNLVHLSIYEFNYFLDFVTFLSQFPYTVVKC